MSTEDVEVSTPSSRPMRADAVRTRKALLQAAAEVFAEDGTEGTIAEIATRAGIGKGTVFRHFPTKEDLVAAIIGEEMVRLTAEGRRVAEQPDADAALLQFMSAGVDLYANKSRAFVEALGAVPDRRHPEAQVAWAELLSTAEALAGRAHAEGSLRPGVDGQDVMMLICGVYHASAALLATDPSAWRRYLQLTFDGMCSSDSELPPLSSHDSSVTPPGP